MIGSIYDGQDPCLECVFRFNQMCGEEEPCNMCISGSEFIQEDEETIVECGWLEDAKLCSDVIDIIDDIFFKLDTIDRLIPNMNIKARCSDAQAYLKALKSSIVETYVKSSDSIVYGTHCYGIEEETDFCGYMPIEYCEDKECPF